MVSKKSFILKYVGMYIVTVSFFALLILLDLKLGLFILDIAIVMAIITGIYLTGDLVSWKRVNKIIYPVYLKEGFSSHFFEVAEEYGATLETADLRSRYYLALMCYYQTMEQHDKALTAFTRVDASYIHQIEKKIGLRKRQLVMQFYNNGLYACLKTGHIEDAKRIYQDGCPFLLRYEKSSYVLGILDTLAEYHYQMEEYEKEAYYDEKLMAIGKLPAELMQAATKRLEIGRKYLADKKEQEDERG